MQVKEQVMQAISLIGQAQDSLQHCSGDILFVIRYDLERALVNLRHLRDGQRGDDSEYLAATAEKARQRILTVRKKDGNNTVVSKTAEG
jgi:hypothetical protein